MKCLVAILSALGTFSSVYGHMSLSYPAPFRAAINPYVPQSEIDYSITSPLESSGANFPCKGYQSDLGTTAGTSVASWNVGSQHNFTVLGSATHGGGSCQAALSYDKGVSWKVIHSYQGSCPLQDGQSFDFTIPSDAPTTGSDGTIFAWLWYNMIGNREIYMSCASITINAASGSSSHDAPAVAYSSRPDLFTANMDNGCTTVEGKEVQFPNPGPAADVTDQHTVKDDSGSFTGTCQPVHGIGGEAASGSSSSGSGTSGSSAAAPGAQDASTSAASVATSSTAPTSSQVYASSLSAVSLSGFGVGPSTTSAASVASTFATSIIASSSLAVSSSDAGASSAPSGTTLSSVASVSGSAPSATSSASAPVGTGTGSGTSGMTVSTDGSCGGSVTCLGDAGGSCCSAAGFCGSTEAYCGQGCQAAFGTCGTFTNSTASSSVPSGAKFRFHK